jgi:hypothetical protein
VRSFRLIALVATAALIVSCSEDEDLKDTRPIDTGAPTADAEAEVPITVDDTGTPIVDAPTEESSSSDTGMLAEAAPVDSGAEVIVVVDTGVVAVDTGVVTDTGGDTTVVDSGVDSAVTDSGTVVDSAVVDSTIADTGSIIDSTVTDTETDTAFDSAELDTDPGLDTAIDSGDLVETDPPETDPPDTDPGDTPLVLPDISFDGAASPGAAPIPMTIKLATTTPGVSVSIMRDHRFIHVTYDGVASSRDVVLYFATGAKGARATELLGGQRALFAAGFTPDRAVHIGAKGVFKQWSGQQWMTMPIPVFSVREDNRVEVRIPLASLGSEAIDMTSFIVDPATETFAGGVGIACFIDGYSPAGAPKTLARWVRIDRGGHTQLRE